MHLQVNPRRIVSFVAILFSCLMWLKANIVRRVFRYYYQLKLISLLSHFTVIVKSRTLSIKKFQESFVSSIIKKNSSRWRFQKWLTMLNINFIFNSQPVRFSRCQNSGYNNASACKFSMIIFPRLKTKLNNTILEKTSAFIKCVLKTCQAIQISILNISFSSSLT